MRSRLVTFAALASVGLGVFVGCGSQRSLDSSTPCKSDGDCASGQTCRQPKAPGQTPQVVAPNPCQMLQSCTETAQCSSGYVCGPYTGNLGGAFGCPPSVCQPPCQEGSCPVEQRCDDDGVCRYQPCDETGALACAEHYECDPVAAAAGAATPLPIYGSDVQDGSNPTREKARGCVPKRCDEDGGFVCRSLWSCDPPNATNEPSGCTPDPCAESGQCESASYICEPMGDGPRPGGTDRHGCVIRNCDEGFACVYMPDGMTNYAHCDAGAERADTYGCVIAQCDEEPGCPTSYTCEPAAPASDPRGCRILRCDEPGGVVCPAGYLCDRTSTSSSGCRYDELATGGTGGVGVGGASGSGGVAAGGVGAVGGSGGTAARGGTGAGGAGGSGANGTGGSATGGSSAQGGTGAVSGGGTSAGGSAGSGMTGMCVAAP